MATMMMNEPNYRDGNWEFLDQASVLTREDPPSSSQERTMEARNNLETLRKLLLSSTPGGTTTGGTPGTLEPQQQEDDDNNDNVDISQEINALIHFVDNFEFQSPIPSFKLQQQNKNGNVKNKNDSKQTRRQPLMDRTNEEYLVDHESIISGQGLNAKEQYAHMNNTTQEPDGRLLYADRSDVELSPEHLHHHRLNQKQQHQQQQQQPQDADWEKFQQLVRQVENALQDANEEREATHSWARQVREATKTWVQEQRAMIEQERANHQGSFSSEKDKTVYEAKIERLENTIRGLELDLKTTELHHQTNEKRLHNIIQYQQDNYHKLEKTLRGGQGSTPWANKQPPQEYVHSLEARTQELRDKTTPWAPNTEIPQQQQQQSGPISSSSTKHNDTTLPEQRKIAFTDNAADKPKPTAKSWMTPPHPMKSTIHKPFDNSSKSIPLPKGLSNISGGGKTKRIVTFANGAQKEIRDDSSSVVRFPNGDIQIFSSNQSVAYFHAKTQVIQVSTRDGSDIYEFPNRQVERHYPDGRKIVKFPDGTKKRIFPNGMVETFTSCGKYLVMERPDGSREVKTLR